MDKNELHTRLVALFGEVHTTRKAAAALGVTSRAVERWLSGQRSIPGPVIAYLELRLCECNHCEQPMASEDYDCLGGLCQTCFDAAFG